MLSKMAGLTESNRELWQLLAGTSTRFPPEVLRAKLDINKEKLLCGLSYYKKPRTNGREVLKKERGLSGDQMELILKAATEMDLDEVQTFDLYCMYTSLDRRVTVKQLKECMGTNKGMQWLVGRLRDFYITERLYLIRVMTHLFSSTLDINRQYPSSIYKDIFAEFVRPLYDNENFINKYIDQYIKNVDDTKVGAESKSQGGCTGLNTRVREQCELLELILIYYYRLSQSPSTKPLWRLTDKFQTEGYGHNSEVRRTLEGGVWDQLIDRRGFLQALLLIQLLQTEGYLSEKAAALAAESNSNTQRWRQLQILTKSSLKEESEATAVVLFAMGVVHQFASGGGNEAAAGGRSADSQALLARKCLARGQETSVFTSLKSSFGSDPFSGKTVLALISRYIIRDLLSLVVEKFGVDTMLDFQGLYSCTATLLKYEEIATEFWQSGLETELGLVLQECLGNFPLAVENSINILTSLASANRHSARQVSEALKSFCQYTERLDDSCSLSATPDPHTWRLNADRRPYHYASYAYSGDRGFVIRAGTLGEIIEDETEQTRGRQQQQHQPMYAGRGRVAVIQWTMDYDAWDVLLELIHIPLVQISHGAGAVEEESVNRSMLACRLVAAILHSAGATWCCDNVRQLSSFVAPLFQTVHRFSALPQAPSYLLTGCIEVLAQLLSIDPIQINQDLNQTGFFPSVTLSNYSDDVLQIARTLRGGSYGHILAGTECVVGDYPLTTAYLNYTLALVNNIEREEELDIVLPLFIFITQHIFPAWLNWRYCDKKDFNVRSVLCRYESDDMEAIGQKCMTIFLRLLDRLAAADMPTIATAATAAVAATDSEDKVKVDSAKKRCLIRRVILQQLLDSGTSGTVLRLIDIGVEGIEAALANQDSVVEGQGVELINLVVMAMTLLNRLLAASSAADAASSPIAQLLTGQHSGPAVGDWAKGGGAKRRHSLATLTQYIYHRHEPRLPAQATLLLKNISALCPMLVLACLDKDAEPIRDAYLSRLAAVTEDVNLKVEILNWLSTCVHTQPGVLELFLNIPISSTGSASGSSTGSGSLGGAQASGGGGKMGCLQIVMNLLASDNQDTFECPAELNCALLEFIHTLWEGKRLRAISILTNRKEFWPAVFRSLYKDLDLSDIQATTSSSSSRRESLAALKRMSSDVCSAALALRTIALDLYGSLNSITESLEKELSGLINAKRLLNWSEYIKTLLQWMSRSGAEVLTSAVNSRDLDNFPLRLLLAWRDLLTVLTTNQLPVNKNEKIRLNDTMKNQILADLLSATLTQFESEERTPLCTQMTSALLNSYLILLRNFNPRCVTNPNEALSQLMIVIGQARLAVDSGTTFMSALTAALGGASLLLLANRKPASSVSSSSGKTVLVTITRDKNPQSVLDQDLLCRQCLPMICETVQMCTKLLSYLPSSASSSTQPISSSGHQATTPTRRHKLLKMLSVAVSVLSELMAELLLTTASTETSPTSLHILHSFSLVPCLLTTLISLLQTEESDLEATRSILLLFQILAQTPQGSEALAMNNVCKQLCVLVNQLYATPTSVTDSSSTVGRGGVGGGAIYQNDSSVYGQGSSRGQVPDYTGDHFRAYRLYVTFIAAMLKSRGTEFVQDALDFVGVHEKRMHECFDAVLQGRMTTLSDSLLDEVQQTCGLISTLSPHRHLWRNNLPNSLNSIMTHMCALLQTCGAILNRSRLDVRLGSGGKDGAGVRPPKFARTISSSSGTGGQQQQLLSQLSTDDSSAVESNSSEVQAMQNRLLQIVSHCLTALRHFTASLLSLIADPMLDLSIYDRFVAISFSPPSLEQQEPVLSFGTLISLFNFCLRTLAKIEPARPVAPSPQKNPASLSSSSVPASTSGSTISRKLVIYIMESAVHLTLCHSLLHLRNTEHPTRDKQLLKRELAAELNACSAALQRHLRCLSSSSASVLQTPSPGAGGGPQLLAAAAAVSGGRRSAGGAASAAGSSSSSSSAAVLFSQEWSYFRLMDLFIKQIYK